MLDIFVYIHDSNKVDVLDFMYYEPRQCVQGNKSLIYAPFIQALIESVFPEVHLKYRTSIPKHANWIPTPPAPYVPPKKGRNPRPDERATFTTGCASTACIPCGNGKLVATEANFTREEK